MQPPLTRPESGLLVVNSTWSALQLLRRNKASEERASSPLCIPAPLSWEQRFHEPGETPTLSLAVPSAG